jgi:hypothetical protein
MEMEGIQNAGTDCHLFHFFLSLCHLHTLALPTTFSPQFCLLLEATVAHHVDPTPYRNHLLVA